MAIPSGGSGVRVVLHHQTIYRAITVGMALDHVRAIADTTVQIATATAPKRTGRLAKSVGRSRGASSGPNRSSVRVTATARYAKYVMLGTRPIIISRRGADKMMHLPPHGRHPEIYTHFVSGQEANPFLQLALNLAMKRHGHK